MNFGSDNQSGASERIMSVLLEANKGVSSSYGSDEHTLRAEQMLVEMFECELKAYFVGSGTAANCLALSCLAKSWDTILCHGHSHILNDELTAPEFYTGGARLLGFDLDAPKLGAESVQSYLSGFEGHGVHSAVPKVLSLTQLSETGEAYTPQEISALSSIARHHDMYVHMDGARFANALVSQNVSAAELTWKAGVDVLCLGASKNGAIAAEAVVFFQPHLANDFEYMRKRAGHLLSKGRFLGVQFCAWLEGEHWKQLASHSNKMASILAQGIDISSNAQRVWEVGGNEVFALISNSKYSELLEAGAVLAEWPKRLLPKNMHSEQDAAFVRMVMSHTTGLAEVESFLEILG